MLVNGLGGRISAYSRLIETFCDTFQFLSWDYRGLFDSSPPRAKNKLRVMDHAKDCEAVLKAFDVKQAVFIGWSMGVEITLEAYRNLSPYFKAMVLLNGTEGEIIRSMSPGKIFASLLLKAVKALHRRHELVTRSLHRLIDLNMLPFLLPYIGLIQRNQDVFLSLMKDYLELDTSYFFEILLYADRHTAKDILPRIAVPCLVIGGEKDWLSPVKNVRRMARQIPGAELRIIPRASHYALLEYPEEVISTMDSFFRKHNLY